MSVVGGIATIGVVSIAWGMWRDWRETKRNEACRRALVARTEAAITKSHEPPTTEDTP